MIYAYIRCSTANSAMSGLSPESQRRAIKQYVSDRVEGSWGEGSSPDEDPGFFADLGVSGWSKKLSERPGGSAMLSHLVRGDHVVFYSLDRGFRSVSDFSKTLESFEAAGVNVHVVTENLDMSTANGKLLAHVMSAFAQWKSDAMSERIRESHAAGKSKGKKKEKLEIEGSGYDYNVLTPPDQESSSGRVFTYARVSHVNSAESGLSIEAQREATRKYSSGLRGVEYGGHFEDLAVSAYSIDFKDRKAGGELFKRLKPGDHIVVSRLDRGFRSLSDMASTIKGWRDSGISLHLADTGLDSSSIQGDIFLGLLCSMAQWESAMVSKRTKEAMALLKSTGRQVNKEVPYGFTLVDKRVVLDPDAVLMVWWAWHLVETGMTYRQAVQHIELSTSQKEKRKPIPITGRFTGNGMKLEYPKYDYNFVFKCHKIWPKFKEMIRERSLC